MATVLVRNVVPYAMSRLVLGAGGPTQTVSRSGTAKVRALVETAWSWSESFRFPLSTTAPVVGYQLFAILEDYYVKGEELQIKHQAYDALLGAGGGTPLVNGASQTGRILNTDGWPNSTTVLRAGDLVQFAGSNKVYMVTVNAISDGSGVAALVINPGIVAGQSPANNAAITTTASVEFRAYITSLRGGDFGPSPFVGDLTVTYRELT